MAKKSTETPVNPNDEKLNEGEINTEETTAAKVEETENQEETTETPVNPNAPKFSKMQILGSKWFTHRRDILTVLLKDDEQYTHAQVDKILGEFLKGKVN